MPVRFGKYICKLFEHDWKISDKIRVGNSEVVIWYCPVCGAKQEIKGR